MRGAGQGALGDPSVIHMPHIGTGADEASAAIAAAVERLRRPVKSGPVAQPEALPAAREAGSADPQVADAPDGVVTDAVATDAVVVRLGTTDLGGLPRTAAMRRLVTIVADAPRALTVTELGLRLGVDQPRASRLVASAEAEDLVRRTPDPDDARRSRIELGDAGRATLEQLRSQRTSRADAALAGFSEDERAMFAALLTRFAAAYRG